MPAAKRKDARSPERKDAQPQERKNEKNLPPLMNKIEDLQTEAMVFGALAITHTNFSTDQSALLALKAQITSDAQNILTANWSSASNPDICNWVGVTCGARHHRVTALNLSSMDFAGVIPPHLGNLSFLVKLDLKNNSFHGPLPQELSRLRR
ncbi:probable LRR receptor-like serine/threonine-protein kinase At3g47570 [Malus domestica]|uniref:probable LRR receptor-like serine/threonine-protein kinase At3g47570 n=1 Tax=Malus domestica TaxID=3750 RepID=UPI003976DE3E